ncbi:MAG: hypothetical protein SGARI_005967 [Bacillariaceae sp.]
MKAILDAFQNREETDAAREEKRDKARLDEAKARQEEETKRLQLQEEQKTARQKVQQEEETKRQSEQQKTERDRAQQETARNENILNRLGEVQENVTGAVRATGADIKGTIEKTVAKTLNKNPRTVNAQAEYDHVAAVSSDGGNHAPSPARRPSVGVSFAMSPHFARKSPPLKDGHIPVITKETRVGKKLFGNDDEPPKPLDAEGRLLETGQMVVVVSGGFVGDTGTVAKVNPKKVKVEIETKMHHLYHQQVRIINGA